MKLSFTTLGCPNWDMDTIISRAVEYGYDGVDFRGYMDEMDIYLLPEFSTDIERTKQKFKDASLEVTCFSSSIKLFTSSERESKHNLEELTQYAHLCQKFKTPYIRVFGGGIGEISRTDALNNVVANVTEMLEIAKEYNVVLILETHDDWSNCEHVVEIFEQVDSDHFKVLWDTHHPYRLEGEKPEKTWETLGEWIVYTHWKDSYVTNKNDRGYQYCLPGEGDLPLKEMYRLVKDNGYNGYFTFEWEKRWWPNIEEPEIAFPAYVTYMKNMAAEL